MRSNASRGSALTGCALSLRRAPVTKLPGSQTALSTRGMAVPLVLVFATIMGLLATFVIKSNSQNFRQNRTSFSQLQATFAARAGMEHALLKAKYFHKGLFDAACFAQGRNPLFNFDQPIDTFTNPGPKFCIFMGDASPNSTGFISPAALSTSLSGALTNPSSWLECFRTDITSKQDVNLPLSMNPLPTEIHDRMKFPYVAGYQLTAVEVLAQNIAESEDLNSVTNQVVVKLTVVATATSPFTNSSISEPEMFTQELTRTVRISRDRAP